MQLDDENIEIWNVYLLVRNQVKLTPMGDIIGLDYVAVLDVIKLYFVADEIKRGFESVLECFSIERELIK